MKWCEAVEPHFGLQVDSVLIHQLQNIHIPVSDLTFFFVLIFPLPSFPARFSDLFFFLRSQSLHDPQAKVTDCERIESMELCANAPGCIFCLEAPSFFNRRVLKSPFPDVDSGGELPAPTTGSCTTGSLTNQCQWFPVGMEEQSHAQRLRIPRGLMSLLAFFMAAGCALLHL